jgi:hypothetical protein
MVDPWLLGCVLLTALNDHVLKGAFPGVVTGKLSDVAGLAFFPALVASLLEFGGQFVAPGWIARTRTVLACAAVTAFGFTAVKVSARASDAYEQLLRFVWGTPGYNVVDPTDLLALPAVGISVLVVMVRRAAQASEVTPNAARSAPSTSDPRLRTGRASRNIPARLG